MARSSNGSPTELDTEELVAHAEVIAVLHGGRPGEPDERAVGAAEVVEQGAAAVPRDAAVPARQELVVRVDQIAVLAADHHLVVPEVADVANPAGGQDLRQPRPRLARRRAEHRDAVADQ